MYPLSNISVKKRVQPKLKNSLKVKRERKKTPLDMIMKYKLAKKISFCV